MQNTLNQIRVLLIFLSFLTFCYSTTLEETFKKQIPASDIIFVGVYNENGRIEIEGWDRSEIEIIAQKKVRASNPERARKILEKIEIDIHQSVGRIEIETVYPDKDHRHNGFFSWLFQGGNHIDASVEYIIQIPKKMDVQLISSNGGLQVNDCHGYIDLRTTNGKIEADDIRGRLNCKTTNGSITASLYEINPAEDMTFKTTNGSIKLYIPEDTNAELEASTTNGSIDCELSIQAERSKSQTRLLGNINDGGALIYLKTTNGNIRISKI